MTIAEFFPQALQCGRFFSQSSRNRGNSVGSLFVRVKCNGNGDDQRTSQPHPAHRVYPYLLRDLQITRPNHVWCTDVTYIPLQRGFLYLVAVMDWASRKVLSWRLSNTLDARFCVDALQEALERYGPPEIFNSDQGSQFTSGAASSPMTAIDNQHDILAAMVRKLMDRSRFVDKPEVRRDHAHLNPS